MTGVFLFGVPLLVCGLAVTLLTREVPLRTTTHAAEREQLQAVAAHP